MPKHCRKNREIKEIDHLGKIDNFLQSDKVAFIPNEQRDINRYWWHSAGEQLGIATKTIKVWRSLALCGSHHKPIIGLKPSIDPYSKCYDSDYECDYECDDDED